MDVWLVWIGVGMFLSFIEGANEAHLTETYGLMGRERQHEQ